MEQDLDFNKLYRIQDKVLSILFGLDNSFYLTGGTALHRFYYNMRYSDDLDFFSQQDPHFHEFIEQFLFTLREKKIVFTRKARSRDFSRIMVQDYLRVDFVNDYVYREGISRIFDGFRIDNVINILTNKIGALTDRDEAKDFFDLFAIAYHENFSWADILKIADKKAPVDKDQISYRIETFPMSWLNKIKTIKPLTVTETDISRLLSDLREEKENSLKC